MKNRLLPCFMGFAFRLALVALAGPGVSAAVTRTWDGSASGYWTNANNWAGGVAPNNGDLLVFPVDPIRLVMTNSVGRPTNFTALLLNGGGYVLHGPSLSITNGLTNAAPINSINTISTPLAPRVSQTWKVAAKTTLVLNSNVTYAGLTLFLDADGAVEVNGGFAGGANANLTKLGAGRLQMNAGVNGLNQVRIGGGFLEVAGVLTANSLILSNGTILSGAGTVPFFTTAGEIRPGDNGGSAPGVLTVSGAGAFVLERGGRLSVLLRSPTPGTGHDQLKVAAPPNLARGSLSVFRDAGFPLTLGQKFVIITNTGAAALTTTFTNLPAGGFITNALPPTTIFQISYSGGNGNDVELTVVDVAFSPTGVARTWDAGGGNNRNWSMAANWDANTLPNRGDDLVFPATVSTGSRSTTNDLGAATAEFNRLWFGGQNAGWILRGGGLNVVGGLVGTNPFPAGSVELHCARVNLLGSQTWNATNFFLRLGAPVVFNGHALTIALNPDTSVSFDRDLSGPGTLVARSGFVSLPSNLAASNLAVRIEGASLYANDVFATGPEWQLTEGVLSFRAAVIPGLNATGGRLEPPAGAGARIAGNLTLAPVCTMTAVFDTPAAQPLLVTGTVALNGARLEAGPDSLALIGVPLMLISNAGPNAVSGTFADLPQGALLAFTNLDAGTVFLSRISYTGGDGNDVVLTPELPPASGISRFWSGAGADPFWATTGNWLGNTAPGTGDDVRFPVSAARRANTNEANLTLNSLTWDGSNYLHAGNFALLNGLRAGATAGTNQIAVRQALTALGAQTWAVSNAAARLRIFADSNESDGGSSSGYLVDGLGPITKTGAGGLELAGLTVRALGEVIVDGGTLRFDRSGMGIKLSTLRLQRGRLEAMCASAHHVIATNGELALEFAVLDTDEVIGGLSVLGDTILGSNVTMSVQWVRRAPVALDARGLNLNGAKLDVLLPPGLAPEEVILVARFPKNRLSGFFANLPNGSVTNFGGRALEIQYGVSLPGTDPSLRFIVLTPASVPLQFTNIERLAGGDVILRGLAAAGALVGIDGTTDFATYQALGSTVANGAGRFTFLDSSGGPTNRFYRAFLPAP